MSPVRAEDLPEPVRARLAASGALPAPSAVAPGAAVRPPGGPRAAPLLVTSPPTGAGPWLRAYQLVLHGPVRSKSNRRRFRASPTEREAWRADRVFDAALAAAARSAQPAGWLLGERGSPVASRPAVVMVIVARGRLDAANLPKSVPDALEGVAYLTDASLAAVSAFSVRGPGPAGVVALAQLEPGSPLEAVSRALAELAGRALDQLPPAAGG